MQNEYVNKEEIMVAVEEGIKKSDVTAQIGT